MRLHTLFPVDRECQFAYKGLHYSDGYLSSNNNSDLLL